MMTDLEKSASLTERREMRNLNLLIVVLIILAAVCYPTI
jgi:hypothetical protein